MRHAFLLYKAGVPLINNWNPSYDCYEWVDRGINTIKDIKRKNGKVTEEAFTEAVREATRRVEGTYS